MCPLVGEQTLTPEQAIAQHLCPECGADLKKTNAIAERNRHWRTEPPNGIDGDEARKRRALLNKYILDNDVKTSDQLEAAAQLDADKARAAAAAAPPRSREEQITDLREQLARLEAQGS